MTYTINSAPLTPSVKSLIHPEELYQSRKIRHKEHFRVSVNPPEMQFKIYVKLGYTQPF